ncbi:MAG: four-helix bundle copper-binding protein [Flavihumibacter sp.]
MITDTHASLLKALNNCVSACQFCAVSCVDDSMVANMRACIKLDLDCADICHITASLSARVSPHAKHLLQECAEICEACAEECEKHSHMEHCRLCAEACRACAQLCRAA